MPPSSSLIGAVADVHGNFDALGRAMARHPEVPAWLCVGDLASRTGAYPDPPVPLYWIKGNNEDFDRIAAWQSGAPAPPTLRYIPNGTAVQVGGIRVAGVGGTYAPTWFDVPADELPRRHGGRQAAALRPRGDRGVRAAARHRHPAHARGAASVSDHATTSASRAARAGGSMPARPPSPT
jgi:hypothetical protein